MSTNFTDWTHSGWLVPHQTSRQEVGDLLAVIERDLADSQVGGLSADWRLAIAYNAALQAATVALYACGYRASREAHHFRVFQTLSLTIGSASDVIATLDHFRKKRNQGGYEVSGATSELEAEEMLALATRLAAEVCAWLDAHHPALRRSYPRRFVPRSR